MRYIVTFCVNARTVHMKSRIPWHMALGEVEVLMVPL
ncbi:hypothetical protein J2S57_005346 [Kineosporia succinea]|uniref:Uncharacterized protein n=1 Tax=Kineosporia succinea TaxID=84632 RepID=A0ABT9PA75_9ACTN|nr:hypothetical protein [Kineosporia succinea]